MFQLFLKETFGIRPGTTNSGNIYLPSRLSYNLFLVQTGRRRTWPPPASTYVRWRTTTRSSWRTRTSRSSACPTCATTTSPWLPSIWKQGSGSPTRPTRWRRRGWGWWRRRGSSCTRRGGWTTVASSPAPRRRRPRPPGSSGVFSVFLFKVDLSSLVR